MALTREELKAKLASKENKLGEKALAVIEAGESLGALQALVEKGAALVVFQRDPYHPRSRYRTKHLIAATFETVDNPPQPTEQTLENGVVLQSHILSFNHGPDVLSQKVQTRLAMFRYLLPRVNDGGDNNFRGDLFASILNSAFYHDANPAKIAFAQALIEAKPEAWKRFTKYEYTWHGSLKAFETFLKLGGDVTTPGALHNVLTYAFCSGNGNEITMPIRQEIAQRMHQAGARLTLEEYKRLYDSWTSSHAYHCKPEHIAFLDSIKPAEAVLLVAN